LETFTEPKELAENPHYQDQRRKSLAGLSDGMIDVPIIELINAFNKLPYCFTLQSCYGHFIYVEWGSDQTNHLIYL
jgi:tRNA(Phe) wybutosine-synthesizing methylase Tyw3